MNKRIAYLDGIKGIACLMILLHHLFVAYFPEVSLISEVNTGFIYKFSQSPFSFIINGEFWVMVFCIISAFILSSKIMKSDIYEISKTLFKRYLRLIVIPIIVCIFVYLSYRVNIYFKIYYNEEVGNLINNSWLIGNHDYVTFQNLIFTPLFNTLSCFNNSFWVLKDMFFGSILSIILSIQIQNMKKNTILYLCMISMLFLFYNSILFCFSLGTLLSQIEINHIKIKKSNNYFVISCFILSLILAGYPTYTEPTNIYSFFSKLTIINVDNSCLFHSIGAFLFLFAINQSISLKCFFSKSIFTKMGNISFSNYVIHIPLIYLFSPHIYNLLDSFISFTYILKFSTIFLSFFLIIIFAILFNKYVERNCNRLIKKLECLFF